METFRKISAYFMTSAENLCDSLKFEREPTVDLTTVKDGLATPQEG